MEVSVIVWPFVGLAVQQFSVWKKWGGHGTRNALKRGKGASMG